LDAKWALSQIEHILPLVHSFSIAPFDMDMFNHEVVGYADDLPSAICKPPYSVGVQMVSADFFQIVNFQTFKGKVYGLLIS
jgi:hypothetical protein